jgi:F-type H+-transporting ATPase subunit b
MDWTKLIFQILNVAIMVFILYRFLFKSARRALDEHSQKVMRALDEAEQRDRQAAATYAQSQERLAQIQGTIALLRQETKEELWRTQKHVLSETRHEIETMRANAKRDLERSHQMGVYGYQCELGRLVATRSERLIEKAGDGSFQKACMAHFLEQLSALPTDKIRDALQTDQEQKTRVRIVSATVLDAASAAQIKEQAQKMVGGPVDVMGKVDPALVAGATMYIRGQILDGSVSGALHTLYERYVADLQSPESARPPRRAVVLAA